LNCVFPTFYNVNFPLGYIEVTLNFVTISCYCVVTAFDSEFVSGDNILIALNIVGVAISKLYVASNSVCSQDKLKSYKDSKKLKKPTKNLGWSSSMKKPDTQKYNTLQ
jgi:hypothetical protein